MEAGGDQVCVAGEAWIAKCEEQGEFEAIEDKLGSQEDEIRTQVSVHMDPW